MKYLYEHVVDFLNSGESVVLARLIANSGSTPREAGAKMIIVNRGPTEQDHLADIRIDAAAGEVMTSIIEKIKAAGS